MQQLYLEFRPGRVHICIEINQAVQKKSLAFGENYNLYIVSTIKLFFQFVFPWWMAHDHEKRGKRSNIRDNVHAQGKTSDVLLHT